MHPNWTDKEIATLREMWGKGYSSRAIAEKLGKSRNAIIGKATRLSLARKKTTTQPAVITPIPKAPAEPQKRPVGGVSILDVGHGQCRAVLGSSGDSNGLAIMCGQPTFGQTSWCYEHLLKHTAIRRV